MIQLHQNQNTNLSPFLVYTIQYQTTLALYPQYDLHTKRLWTGEYTHLTTHDISLNGIACQEIVFLHL